MKIKSSPKVPVIEMVNSSCLVRGEDTELRILQRIFILLDLFPCGRRLPATNMP